MVLSPGRVPYIIRAYVRLNRQRERKLIVCYQKKYLSSMARFEKQQTYIKQKINRLIEWYDEITGMDEVRQAQKKVVEDEKYFRKAQEERRKILNELTEIQRKLKELFTELDNTNRGDDRYVALVTQEHKLLKEEKMIVEKFTRAEQLERDTFAALSSSVKLSHEKERAQSERTKYWSVIGSVLGTVLGIVGSSVNSHFKMNELKELIRNSTNMQLMDCLNSYLETNEKIMEKFKQSLKTADKVNVFEVEEILKTVDKRLADLEEGVKNVEENIGKKNQKIVTDTENGVMVTVPVQELEESLKKEYIKVKMLLFTVAVLSILMPVISKYS